MRFCFCRNFARKTCCTWKRFALDSRFMNFYFAHYSNSRAERIFSSGKLWRFGRLSDHLVVFLIFPTRRRKKTYIFLTDIFEKLFNSIKNTKIFILFVSDEFLILSKSKRISCDPHRKGNITWRACFHYYSIPPKITSKANGLSKFIEWDCRVSCKTMRVKSEVFCCQCMK